MEERETTFRSGLTAGIATNLAYRHLVFGVSALFTMKGFVLDSRYTDASPTVSDETNYYHERYRFNYLTLPLTIAYAQRANGQGVQLSGGGYVACLLGGKVVYDNRFESTVNQGYTYQATVPVKAGSVVDHYTTDFYTKRFDVGVQAGLGYRWKPLLVQAVYQLGLRDLEPAYPNDGNRRPTYYSRNVTISATYFWGKSSQPLGSKRRTDLAIPRYSL
jgi:hypothetical protein